MPKTRVKENMSYYNRLLKRDADRVQDGAYKEVLDKLRTLMERTEELYKPGEQGRYKQMDEAGYQSLMKAYQDMEKACSDYFGDNREKKDLDKSRAHIVKRLQSYVDKDLSHLEKLDRNHLPSLPDAIRKARTVQVDMTGKELATRGGNQSNRIALRSANGTKGFFTEKSSFDKQKSWEELMDSVLPDVPEKYKADFERLRNEEEIRDNFMETLDEAVADDIFSFNKLYGALVRREMTEQETQDYYTGDEDMNQLAEKFNDVFEGYKRMRIKESHMNAAGIQSIERLDQRNSAMTAVADLLGTPKLIAKSTPMAIIRDGKVVEGTFMETAEGVDTNHVSEKDMGLLGCSIESMETPQALKQLAELEVLDYICGNIDRHNANMLYQFEYGDDGKPHLAKITGIDNDDSFGTELFDEEDTYIPTQGGVKRIAAVSLRQASVIQKLNKDMLKETLLPYELTDEEMDAAWGRIGCLKKELELGNIPVLSDEQWKEQTLSSLARKGNNKETNIFERVKKVPGSINEQLKSIQKGKRKNEKPLEFAQGEKVQDADLYRADLAQNHRKLMGLVKEIREADNNLYINSSAFRNMRNALYELGKFSKELRDKYPEEGMKISSEDRQELNRKYTQLKELSQAYIDAKKLSPKTEHGQIRLYLANELRDLAADSCELLGKEAENPQLSENRSPEVQNAEPKKEEPELEDMEL